MDISPDTVRLRFALDAPDQALGLPCGMHFKPPAQGRGMAPPPLQGCRAVPGNLW